MNPVVIARRWGPLVALVSVAVLSWQAAKRASIDDLDTATIEYESSLVPPVFSARRLPETLAAPIAEEAVAPEADSIAERATPTSCVVVSLNDKIVSDTNGDVPLIPASNQKIVTTWTAIELLGADYRFETSVLQSNEVQGGVLTGDLYLVGGGDPFLVTDAWIQQYSSQDGRAFTRLEDLADLVAATGLKEITGRVIGDEALYDDLRVGPWHERLTDQKQAGPLSALSVNQGFSKWPAEYALAASRGFADHPAGNAASVFATLLAERGITSQGTAAGIAPDGIAQLASIESQTVLEIATHVNSYSDNYGAEMLLKAIGLEFSGSGSTAAGAEAVFATLSSHSGFPMGGIVIDDGSGLSESDRLTCGLLVAVLSTASPESAFASTLSIGGERGSLKARFDETEVDGQLFAKSGTLQSVSALSGIVESDMSPDIYSVFSVLVNEEGTGGRMEFEDLQQELVIILGEYPDAPAVQELDPLDVSN